MRIVARMMRLAQDQPGRLIAFLLHRKAVQTIQASRCASNVGFPQGILVAVEDNRPIRSEDRGQTTAPCSLSSVSIRSGPRG
jgi:hypothetical protein